MSSHLPNEDTTRSADKSSTATLLSPIRFNSGERSCCGCFKLLEQGKRLVCSGCGVMTYCNKTCQRVGWSKLAHKQACRARAVKPPSQAACKIPVEDEDGKDVDAPHTFILVKPRGRTGGEYASKAEFLTSCSGFDDDALLDKLKVSSPALVSDCTEMCARFKWVSGTPGKFTVPGFCPEWDTTRLFCVCDDNYLNESAYSDAGIHINSVASLAMMIGTSTAKALRGNAVFFCLDDKDRVVKLTRRDLLNLANYNHQAGAVDAVPDRVHFENIRRTSVLATLRQQGFQTVTLDDEAVVE